MARRTKPIDTRPVLARNLLALLKRAADTPARLEPATAVEIEQKSKNRVGKSTIYRILNAESYCQTDTLEAIADLFDVEAWTLLSPEFDPHSPLIAIPESVLAERIEARATDVLQDMIGRLAGGSVGRPGSLEAGSVSDTEVSVDRKGPHSPYDAPTD